MWIYLKKAPKSLSTTQVINANNETTVHHFNLQCVKPCESHPREFTSPPSRSSPCHSAQKKYLPCIPNTSRAQEGGGSRVAHVWPRVSTQWTSGETVTPQLSLSSTHSNLSPTARTSASGMPTISRRTYLHDLQGVVGDMAVEKQ